MAFTETPAEKKKRQDWEMNNLKVAKAKEAKAEAEDLRKFNETTKVDTSENTNAMGDTYKKGGKIMKKAKRYDDGGSIDSDVRSRAMKSVEGLEGIKGSDIEDETGTVKGSIKRNEYGDLYDSEMKATPKDKVFSPSPKGAKAFTRAETGGGAALMTRKDRSGMPKTAAKKSSSYTPDHTMGMAMKKGGKVSSASKRADGCAIRGKTRA